MRITTLTRETLDPGGYSHFKKAIKIAEKACHNLWLFMDKAKWARHSKIEGNEEMAGVNNAKNTPGQWC